MNEEQVIQTFEPRKALQANNEQKITITQMDVYNTITRIAKNKASSADGITDTLFKKKTWNQTKYEGSK